MTNKKKNGVYYTPNVLADFMVNYIIDNFDLNNNLNILEPSCGDGIFLKYLFSNSDVLSKDIKIDIIEINSKELKKSLERINRLKTNSVEVKDYNIDYLEYNTDTKYDI
ncbi:N-6 DNA methylase, partial [Halonatronum saccharophilum]|uniref:N-6 DNA methylase n=1 Tax=Halonatronum saccharophilum TaxID=150060 RepID=UPI0004848899